MKTLALGKPGSAFYGSIRHVLHHMGELVFRDETEFASQDELLHWVRSEGVDQVLMPNPYGNEVRLACYRELRDAGVPTIASDRGALPGSWFFDVGFNFDSPSYRPEAWDRSLAPDESRETAAYLEELRGSAVALESQGPRRAREALRARLGLPPDRPVLFVPLQRPNDTVVRYFAGDPGSLEELVARVERVSARLEDEGQPWSVVLKKHPLELKRIPVRREHAARVRYAPDSTHVHDLLELADAVLTLNSGVGLLSLCFGRPTASMGQAFYAHPGLAVPTPTEVELHGFLHDPKPPNEQSVRRFVHHLRRNVYSFGTFETEVRQTRGSAQRITRHIEFDELRILGREYPCRGDRVVVVSPVIPTGVYRGSQSRVANVLEALIANGARVSLAVLNTSFGGRASRDIVREIRAEFPTLDRIEVRRHPKFDKSAKGRLRRIGARTADALTLGPHRIANLDTCPRSFQRAVAKICEETKPRFILVNYAKLSPTVPADFDGVRIVDTHDYQTQFLIEDQDRNGLRRHVNRHVFRWSEHHELRKFDRIVAINPEEAEVFRRELDADVFTLPAFSKAHDARPEQFWTFEHDALLVASMSNFNVKGLLWFAERVLPRIRERRPDFVLKVVGNIARSKEVRGAQLEHVELLGVVPELGPLYEQSACVLAPLLGGAGMKIKVVEALSYGKAIVATPKALEGIRAEDGVHLRSAATPSAFAEAVLSILESDATRRKLEQGARALHERDHGFEAARRTLEEIFSRPT